MDSRTQAGRLGPTRHLVSRLESQEAAVGPGGPAPEQGRQSSEGEGSSAYQTPAATGLASSLIKATASCTEYSPVYMQTEGVR